MGGTARPLQYHRSRDPPCMTCPIDKPIDELKVGTETREFIRDATALSAADGAGARRLLAVPHCGSPIANYRFANWISRLIRLPKTLTVELLDATLQSVSDVAQGEDPSGNSAHLHQQPVSRQPIHPGARRSAPAGRHRRSTPSSEIAEKATLRRAATAWFPIGRPTSSPCNPSSSSPATTACRTTPKPPPNSNAS